MGTKQTSETVLKNKYPKWKKFADSLDLDSWEEYADMDFSLKKDRRTKTFTLREYYNLIKSGKSGNDLKKEGYFKHLIVFYNELLTHSKYISKEQILEEYYSGINLTDIGKKYGLSKCSMIYFRIMHVIERKPSGSFARNRRDVTISNLQKEFLYGTMAGDGSRVNPSTFSCSQSVLQHNYVMWKYEIMKNIVKPTSLKYIKTWDKRYKRYSENTVFYTIVNTDIEQILNEFYSSGKKVITQSILNKMTDFSVAVWLMDDGTTGWGEYYRRKGHHPNPATYLCTDGFSIKECELIVQWFKNRYGINPYIQINYENYPHVYFNVEETPKLFNLVKPYIIPSMMYKINYEAYQIHSKELTEQSSS